MAYAVAYIHSETTQRNLILKVASDDQSKVYLNGKPIYQRLEMGIYVEDQGTVETGVELEAGLNTLVFKVVNEVGDGAGSVRFTDKSGQPVKGLRVSLDPGGR